MAEERETEWAVAADAVQANSGNLIVGVGARARELLGFQAGPYLLGQITVRGIARQQHEADPGVLARSPVIQVAAVMRRQSVSDQRHRTLFELGRARQELDEALIVAPGRLPPPQRRQQ